MSTAPGQTDLGFDPNALREKYRQERDKRVRPDGNEQYQEVKGELARYVEDPYVEPGFTREPLTDEVEIVIIGGGFGGQLAGARLRQAGLNDFRIIEKGGDFGGTWYWNRFPEPSATSSRTSTCRCSRTSASFRRRSTPSLPRSSRTRAGSGRPSTCTTPPASRPRSRSSAGTRSGSAGSLPPTAATRYARALSSCPTDRSTVPSCRRFPVSTSSRATASTPAAGTTHTRVATRLEACTSSRTSGWGSSVRAPPLFSACPTWASTLNSSTYSSARPRRWTSAATSPPTPSG